MTVITSQYFTYLLLLYRHLPFVLNDPTNNSSDDPNKNESGEEAKPAAEDVGWRYECEKEFPRKWDSMHYAVEKRSVCCVACIYAYSRYYL